jgi:hypothetical protein
VLPAWAAPTPGDWRQVTYQAGGSLLLSPVVAVAEIQAVIVAEALIFY